MLFENILTSSLPGQKPTTVIGADVNTAPLVGDTIVAACVGGALPITPSMPIDPDCGLVTAVATGAWAMCASSTTPSMHTKARILEPIPSFLSSVSLP